LLEVEFFDTSLIRGDGCTLDTNLALLDSFGSINCNLIVCRVTSFNCQVKVLVVFKIHVRVNVDILNSLPNDSGHLVSIDVDNWVVHDDFGVVCE